MDLRVEIAGDEVICRQDGQKVLTAKLSDFLANLADRMDAPPLHEPIPETVRFAWRRGAAVVLAMEQRPAAHTVRWLTDDSPAPFGKGATYRTARLAFPFVVLIVAFYDGNLTGQQQCFYRRARLAGVDDDLLLPNLYNVARAYGQTCWLCLANLRHDLAGRTWRERVEAVWSHLFEASFTASSEVHEGMSYWQAMRAIDRRVSSVEAWQEASKQDPFFPLQVEWQPSGRTVAQVMREMLDRVAPAPPTRSVADLMALLNPPPARPRRPLSLWMR